jgi:hypothetical protein
MLLSVVDTVLLPVTAIRNKGLHKPDSHYIFSFLLKTIEQKYEPNRFVTHHYYSTVCLLVQNHHYHNTQNSLPDYGIRCLS